MAGRHGAPAGPGEADVATRRRPYRGRPYRRRTSSGWDFARDVLEWLLHLSRPAQTWITLVVAGLLGWNGAWAGAAFFAAVAGALASWWLLAERKWLCGVQTKSGRACLWDVKGFWGTCKWHKQGLAAHPAGRPRQINVGEPKRRYGRGARGLAAAVNATGPVRLERAGGRCRAAAVDGGDCRRRGSGVPSAILSSAGPSSQIL